MTQKELLRLVKQAVASDERTLQLSEENKDHPQVFEVYCRVRGRLEAFEAVAKAINNDPILLRIHAE